VPIFAETFRAGVSARRRGPPKQYPPTPRLRWVIRRWAKSAEAWHNHRLRRFYPELCIPPRPRPWSPA